MQEKERIKNEDRKRQDKYDFDKKEKQRVEQDEIRIKKELQY